jgi:hypothetical protein
MTTMWIGDLNQYLVIREMFDTYSTDISSEDCFLAFEEYWNRRIDSPKMGYVSGVAGIKVNLAPGGSYHVPLQLKFTSDEEQTFWLLQNT